MLREEELYAGAVISEIGNLNQRIKKFLKERDGAVEGRIIRWNYEC